MPSRAKEYLTVVSTVVIYVQSISVVSTPWGKNISSVFVYPHSEPLSIEGAQESK